MVVKRKKDKLIIEIEDVNNKNDISELTKYLKFLEYAEITSKSKATQKDIEKLSKIIKKGVHKKFIANLSK